MGARINLRSELPGELALFGEGATRVVISCDPRHTRRIKEIGVQYGLAAGLIGQTAPENLEIRLNGKIAVRAAVSELKSAWEGALSRMLHLQTREHLVPEVLQKS